MQKKRIRCSTSLSPEPRRNEFYASSGVIRNPEPSRPDSAMKTAFARGKITNVNANAVGGQTVMLTQRGQRKTVSAYNADGLTKWPTMLSVSHADPSSA